MRNLKKILAMVLALVMSLSLMATAGAANFTDASSINEKYETAIEVLEGLGVFKGYDENGSYSFKPTGEITRAETAAIIYRIVTGDVTDSQVGIYADYNLFTDVPSTSWYAGYVNFCANAEYIKGVGGGKFDPSSRVTGYAALAMILRAIGYTANGGFTGPDWEVQTARTAEARKITKNIVTGTLGQPATRETVAEILFQAILVNMVDHNVLNTLNGNQGYTETDTTLGYKTFKLEQIEGIVMGNEYADLNSEQVLADGQTQLQVAGEENLRNLAITTKITDIGESRYAYITGSKVLAMGDTGSNKVTEFGHACDISTTAKFNAVAEMPAASDIEYFVNFDPWTAGGYDCDQRLEFSVVFYGAPAENAFDNYKGINISRIAAADPRYSVEVLVVDGSSETWRPITAVNGDYVNATTPAYGYPVRYTKVIWAGQTITDTDLTVLESIFATADNQNNNVLAANKITGDVFLGTKSTNSSTDEERDVSNQISYKKFFEDYINDRTREQNWGESFNGDWVKFIDNDGDGACEYAFYTYSFLDEATHTYTNRNGDTVTEFNYFDDNTYDVPNGRYTVRYLDNDGNDTDEVPAVGDKVVAAYIDNQYLVEPALDETVTVSEYSWRNDEITTDKGTYGQSGIGNATDMLELISTMDDKVEYIVYFDHFGYVRAYELPGGTQYALLTELYYTNSQQGNLVDNWPMTVELTTPDAEGNAQTSEYNVASGAGTFRANTPWLQVDNAAATYSYNNWLQPAIAHLGVSRTLSNPTLNLGANKGTPDFSVGTTSTFWPANRQLVKNMSAWSTGAEFNYGVQNYGATTSVVNNGVPSAGWTVEQTYGTGSFTNVAVVNINGTDASLSGAAQLSLDKTGAIRSWNDLDNDGLYDHGTAERPRYAVDYIQLDRTADVVAGAVRYPIGGDDTYKTNNNNYVNAVHDTEYYIVYNGGVYYFKDFANMPKLTNKDNIIHAAYAVARDTSADNAGLPYWVADVIVYEVYDLNDTVQTSVSLAYYTPTRLSGTVQQVETLNSKYGPMVTLTPGGRAWNATAGQWGAEWEGYGFYRLFNDTEPVDNVMTARDIDRIEIDGYGENRVYAGIVTREAYIAGAGTYIDVNMGGGTIASVEVTDKIYSVTTKTAQSDNWYGYNEANLLRYQNLNNSQVKAGDHVIWVNDGAVKAASVASTATLNATKFVVDLGNTTWYTGVYAGADLMTDTPSWLINYTWNQNTGVVTVDSVAGTKAAASNQGEWQRIMYEQGNPAPVDPTGDYTVTIVAATGDALKDGITTKYWVAKGGTVMIPKADIDKTGYTTTSVNKNTGAGGTDVSVGAAVTISGVDYYVIDNINQNITVTVDYTADNYNLSLDVTTNSTGGSNMTISVNGATAVAYTTGNVTVHYGDTYVFTVGSGLNTVGNEYSVTGGTATVANVSGSTDSITISGTVTGNTALVLDAAPAATTPISVANAAGDNATITFTSDDSTGTLLTEAGGNVLRTVPVTFTVAGAMNYDVDTVTYTVQNEAPVTMTPDASGVYSIPTTALAQGLRITIAVTTKSNVPSDVTITNNATGGIDTHGDVYYRIGTTGPWTAVGASATVSVPQGATLQLSADRDVAVTPSVFTQSPTVDETTAYRVFSITGIAQDGTLTIANVYTVTITTGTVTGNTITGGVTGGDTSAALTTEYKVPAGGGLTFTGTASITITETGGTSNATIGAAGTTVAVTSISGDCTLNIANT